MPEKKPQKPKQQENIHPLEQKNEPSSTPEVTSEQVREYNNTTKNAGEKSSHSAQKTLNTLEDKPTVNSEQ